jgi:hypothetical protein
MAWPSSVLSAALESKYSLHEGMVCGYESKIPSEKLIFWFCSRIRWAPLLIDHHFDKDRPHTTVLTAPIAFNMVRTSTKQQFLHNLDEAIVVYAGILFCRQRQQQFLRLVQDDNNDDLLHEVPTLHERIRRALLLYNHLANKRYIFPRGCRQRPADKFSIDLNPLPVHEKDIQPWLNDVEFITAYYRMTRTAFSLLLTVTKICNHSVFHKPEGGSGPPQAPVAHQLLTFLHYLSSPSHSAGGAPTRNHFHISYGSRDSFVRRCVQAI